MLGFNHLSSILIHLRQFAVTVEEAQGTFALSVMFLWDTQHIVCYDSCGNIINIYSMSFLISKISIV